MSVADEFLRSYTYMSLDTWLAFLAIPVSIVVSWYFYRRALPLVEMSYTIQTTNLLGGQPTKRALPQEVTIRFGEQKIDNLLKANYIFWNSGRQPIRREDIAPKSPLHILFPRNTRIASDPNPAVAESTNVVLRASCLKESRTDNDVVVTKGENPQGNKITLQFEYLEPSQGFNAELLYQGEEAMKLPAPDGKIIGMKGDLRRISNRSELLDALPSFLATVGGIIIAAIFVLTSGRGPDFYKVQFERDTLCPQLAQLEKSLMFPTGLEAFIILFVAMGLLMLVFNRVSSHRQVPKDLIT